MGSPQWLRARPFSEAIGWDIQYFEFHGCENAADVQLYLISDMGHEWPERPDDLETPNAGSTS